MTFRLACMWCWLNHCKDLCTLVASCCWIGELWTIILVSYTTMALRGSTWVHYTLPWLYFAVLDSTTLYHGSTPLYIMALLHTTSVYYILPWLSFTLHDSTTCYHGSPWHSYTLPWLYSILPWLYLTLHDSTTFYHGSTWLYYTWLYMPLVHYTIATPSSICLYYTLPWL